jgi:molybdopterin converting factor small subunit
MKVHLQPFGLLKDLLATDRLEWAVEDACTVADLRTELLQAYPAMTAWPVAIAVNDTLAMDDTVLQPGDRILLMPPVSGG